MDLSKAKITISCPKCKAGNVVTLGQVEKSEQIVCVGCGIKITLHDDGSLKKAQGEVDQSLSDLSETIKQVNEKLKINIKF